VLSQHVDLVRSVIRSVAFRHGITGADIDDLESAVWVRLVEHDYRAIRQFRGEASFGCFLRSVVTRLLLDLRVAAWGRWRPSAMARRFGREAVRLESLVYRDGHSVDQALAVLASEGASIPADAVTEIARSRRSTPRRFVAIEDVPQPASVEPCPDCTVMRKQTARQTRALSAALRSALAALPAADRKLLHMRHFKGLKVSAMARTLAEDQKHLYRRLNTVHRVMRQTIERSGLTRDDVRDVLSA
jgi:RNA polymerase sigma factor (sigma-70 family)